jgi:hypothetical protein
MPWQEQVAMVAGEIDSDTGLPAYREVIVTVPRQSGKTALLLAVEVQRCVGWGGPQRVLYSAQSGTDARRKMVDDQFPVLELHRRTFGIRQCNRGVGVEGVYFHNGSLIVVLSGKEQSGHGKTIDLGVQDELFADVDLRREAAMAPMMATRADGQTWKTSTMGNSRSVVWNGIVKRGRRAVEEGRRSGVAFFEWSADKEAGGFDPDDERVWWGCMPALGYTQSVASIRSARESLCDDNGVPNDAEFMRAFLNITNDASGPSVITTELWGSRLDVGSSPGSGLSLGFAVSRDREWGFVGMAGWRADGGVHVELADARPGVGWIPGRVAELQSRWGVGAVLVDGGGPESSVIPALVDEAVPFRVIGTREMCRAAGLLLDELEGGSVWHVGQGVRRRHRGCTRRVQFRTVWWGYGR